MDLVSNVKVDLVGATTPDEYCSLLLFVTAFHEMSRGAKHRIHKRHRPPFHQCRRAIFPLYSLLGGTKIGPAPSAASFVRYAIRHDSSHKFVILKLGTEADF